MTELREGGLRMLQSGRFSLLGDSIFQRCWDPGGHYGLVYICEPGFRIRIKEVKTKMY